MKWGLYIRYLKDFVLIGALIMTGLYKPGTRHFFLRKNNHQGFQGPGPSSESVRRELHIRRKFLFSNLDFQDTLFPHTTPRWSGFVAERVMLSLFTTNSREQLLFLISRSMWIKLRWLKKRGTPKTKQKHKHNSSPQLKNSWLSRDC